MISLREFAYEIRQRIDEGRTSEAIPLAQYLLRRHPRYLRGYQLLAEAALEEGKLADAIEIFSRVMSADPESFPAHAGLASAYTDRNELDNALWHMTRAFESEPGMKAVRDQLRFLYELRDGRAPGRLHLNPAALARNYLRSGAFDVAVAELARELDQDPDRIDLRVALAEAFWFANQPQDAAEMAYAVLDELPLAFKPHLILATFYYQAGEIEKAEIHLRIAQELDPENEIAILMFGEGAPFRAIAIPIDEPENIEKGTGELSGVGQLPEWLRDLSLFTEPEAPVEGVDWGAVIAYEEDWRTKLAAATREAISEYRPNWRAGLRLATLRALRERAGPEQPAQPVEGERDSADTWRESLHDETSALFPSLNESRQSVGTTEWGGITETIALLPPEWKATLRFATEEALAALAPPPAPTHAPPTDATGVDDASLAPAGHAVWVPELRDATERFVLATDEREAAETTEYLEQGEVVVEPAVQSMVGEEVTAPRPRILGRWIPTLRVATEIWVAMQRRGAGRRGTTTASLPAQPVTTVPPNELPLPSGNLAEQRVPSHEWTEPGAPGRETEHDTLVPGDGFIPDDKVNADAGTAGEPGLTARQEIEGAEPADAAAEALTETDSDEAPVTPAAAEQEVVSDEPITLTPLEEARHAWHSGQMKEAMGRFQTLFYEESVPDDELSAALAEWISAGDAPALLYQLLGDVYRRMGRMQDAVAHYREAINRM